ncbi:hypothetical protein Tco_0772424 [Tanacetum coccineum]|uniref:Uncharacterized protein n=1 Tax=Tanacetum coccineum TaxID=301880 RepID=A0ABQ4ZHV1_9ASTR
MTTPITTSTTDSQMHNNIMAAGSKNRPPMLATRRYALWQSRFLRYIDIKLNGDTLRKCIFEGPYTPSTVTIPVVPATDETPEVLERTSVETILNMSPENKEHYQSEKEAIRLLLTGIGDEIYSTVDACKTARDIFTFHDGETMKSYYSRFYKMMNEMIRNNLTVATMQVNVQFLMARIFMAFKGLESKCIADEYVGLLIGNLADLCSSIKFCYVSSSFLLWQVLFVFWAWVFLHLQPKLGMKGFVENVRAKYDLGQLSYHSTSEVSKTISKEVNEIHAERIAKNTNPLALIAATQQYSDPYYQAPKSYKSYAPPSKQSFSTRSHAYTKYKGNEIAKPITPLFESAFKKDSDP